MRAAPTPNAADLPRRAAGESAAGEGPSLRIDAATPWRTFVAGRVTVHGAGYLFAGSFERLALALDALGRPPRVDDVAALVCAFDGHFAVAAAGPSWAALAVDRVRSIPVFCAEAAGRWLIDNRADRLRRAAGLGAAAIDREAALAIAMAGYTIDRATLYRGLHMLGPGECAVLRNGAPAARARYYTYRPWRAAAAPEPGLRKRLADLTLAVIDKHLRSLDGRTLAVPLSAGFDSRLIVSAARHLGYRNVKCFAYGRAGNFEAVASRAVAERLGYAWTFAPATIPGHRRFFAGGDYAAYLDYADSCASVPFVQDMPAVAALKRSAFIPADAVIANGNSGDYISGNHIVAALRAPPAGLDRAARERRILDALYDKHFALWRHLRNAANRDSVHGQLRTSLAAAGAALGPPEGDHGLYEYAEFQDRQCKYVITGERIYEFLGHSWRLPLWDNAYLDFWETVPLAAKAGQALYAEMLAEADWGGVWRGIPVNDKTIRPRWIVPLRWLAKVAAAPMGRARWHRLERRAFQYWLDATCNYAVIPYRRALADRRGQRHVVSWLAEAYLRRHGIALDSFAQA
jgi:asparagine synthase (glutamine-hydrolysing)